MSDSVLPIGGAAHSFGQESLAVDGRLAVESLPSFLRDDLEEGGCFDAVFCRLARASSDDSRWLLLNQQFGAFRVAQESRGGKRHAGTAVLANRAASVTR